MDLFSFIHTFPISDYVIAILLGLAFGSFATALIHRIPLGQSWVFETAKEGGEHRSACPYCGHRLGLKDLIPILSWVMQKGQCRYCGHKIAPLYPLTELATVLGALGIVAVCGLTAQSAVILLALPFLIALIVIDLKEMILPNQLVLITLILGAVYHAIPGITMSDSDLEHMVLLHGGGAVLFFAVSWLLGLIMSKVLKREALGFGDVKFMAVAGLWLGAPLLGSFFIVSGVMGIVLALIWQKITQEPRFPFGPALIFAFYVLILLKTSQIL